jgi:hypothetical protein
MFFSTWLQFNGRLMMSHTFGATLAFWADAKLEKNNMGSIKCFILQAVYALNSFQCPSEMGSMVLLVTLRAV